MNPNPAETPPARTPSLSQRVVDGVTQRIRSGDLGPGARVPTEPALMAEYGVSRSVVREAVSRLQAGGLVRTRQGVGSFVLAAPATAEAVALLQPPDAALKLRQKLAMLELRLSIEADAAALAAQRRTHEQLAAMERAVHDFEVQHSSGEATVEADFRFHELIAQATGNEYFVHVLRSLSSATIPRQGAPDELHPSARPAARPTRRGAAGRTPASAAPGQAARQGAASASAGAPRFGDPSPQLRGSKDLTAAEHRAVLDAIRRGDASMARAAMFMHLNNSRERMKSAAA